MAKDKSEPVLSLTTGQAMTGAELLHLELTERGIPVVGVSSSPPRIDYAASATALQITQGDALLATWDFRKRKAKELQALYAEVNALPNADLQKLLKACICSLLQQYPILAKKFGIAIDGDEIDT